MNLNLPSDIEKKVDHVIISLPFKGLSSKNVIKNVIPSENTLNFEGNAKKFRITPGDASISFSQKQSKSGIYWDFSFSFDLFPNSVSNFHTLNRFTNKKVVLLIGTSTYIYMIGSKDQPLHYSFREVDAGFKISFSGRMYFPAARKPIVSFRSSF